MGLGKRLSRALRAPSRVWRDSKVRSFQLSAAMTANIRKKIDQNYSKIEVVVESAVLHLEAKNVPSVEVIDFFSKLASNKSDLKFSKDESGLRETIVLLVIDWRFGRPTGLVWLKEIFQPYLAKCKEYDQRGFSLESLAKSAGVKVGDFVGDDEGEDSSSK